MLRITFLNSSSSFSQRPNELYACFIVYFFLWSFVLNNIYLMPVYVFFTQSLRRIGMFAWPLDGMACEWMPVEKNTLCPEWLNESYNHSFVLVHLIDFFLKNKAPLSSSIAHFLGPLRTPSCSPAEVCDLHFNKGSHTERQQVHQIGKSRCLTDTAAVRRPRAT